MTGSELRKRFIKFFEKHNHTAVESSSLVPQNDPTLLFTNAGMVQFKDVFLGKEQRPYKRAVSCQKCVRAGGKHNDLENVGFTARHHTFFEMLGNFSFGDYFKKDAIKLAWEFVTKELKLPQNKLYVTVFQDDDEAAEIWHTQEGVPKDRIYRFGEKDNFWQMGDVGPCGPCSEIFIDRGEKYCRKKPQAATCKMGCDCDRYMEIWNLVFMQYERNAKGELTPLPKPSVDTGAGLERIASVLQNVETNFDTDLFVDIMQKTGKLCGKAYHPTDPSAVSFRVIADHARAATFLIGDGVIPSNEGRGYVLRRIIRRAIRHGKKLGFDKPFLHKVCLFVVGQMSEAYAALLNQKDLIDKCVFAEEEQFLRTLENGLVLLADETAKLKKGGRLPGDVAFRLYDTYGFPLDLTRTICDEEGIGIDEAGFEKSMNEQRGRSRKNWQGSGEKAIDQSYHEVWERLKTAGKIPQFVGFDALSVSSAPLAVVSQDGAKAEVVFAKTPFYPEGGGQVGDKGLVVGPAFKAKVVDTQKPVGDLIVNQLEVLEGQFSEKGTYQLTVDDELRSLAARNHTATHLLHWALREVLGKHVKQSGSLVNAELLRFDFTHFQALTPEELQKVEQIINEKIWADSRVDKAVMTKDAALAKNAIAFFGEKYGDSVRVVSVGDYSVELCGGTHVNHAAEINIFKIVSEGGIAAGVRRIIAYTSKHAFAYLADRDAEVRSVRGRLKASTTAEVETKIDKMLAAEKDLRRQIEGFQSQNVGAEIDKILAGAKILKSGVKLVAQECNIQGMGPKQLRDMAERLINKDQNLVSVLGLADPEEKKVLILAAVGKNVPKTVKASEIVTKLAPLIDGRGGGKPDMAQAGGTKLQGLPDAIAKAADVVSTLL